MIVVRGAGPFYWGIEEPEIPVSTFWMDGDNSPYEDVPLPASAFELSDQRRLTWAWLVEVEEPFRKSFFAFRVKLSKTKAIHIGLCRKGEPTRRALSTDEELWDRYSPSAISGWGVQREESNSEEESVGTR